ncbi:MAG: choice-of-anchor D domain-containing protein [Gammaproteobacteria bacterium]
MKTGTFLQGATALIILTIGAPGLAAPVPIDTVSSNNGISDLYSATFDGGLVPCTGSSPSYCAFFGGDAPAGRQIIVTPTPTKVGSGVPLGFTIPPAAGSFLNLTRNAGNTQVTLAGGTISFPPLTLTISGSTVVNASGAGIVFNSAPQVATLNAQGQAEFLVNLAPTTAVDFSEFTVITNPPAGSCSGPLCALIPILTLDMLKYRLFIDYDPTFSTFTASLIGQTANNSLLSVTMDSAAPQLPKIDVTDSVAPAGDLSIPFGNVTETATATQTVTVTNTGNADLILGAIASADALALPFALPPANDTCSGATVAPSANCTFDVTFSPASSGPFSDAFDIPSNDASTPSVTFNLSGTGVAMPVPKIVVTDSVAPATDLLIPFGTASVGTQVDQTVTVTNTGNADLTLGNVAMADALTAPFSIVSDTCSNQTVAPTVNCSIGVRFAPVAAGSFSEAFDIPSDDASDPTVTVAVTGTGASAAAPDINVAATLDFGKVTENTTRDQNITVTNSGSAALVITSVAGADPVAAPFSIKTDNCTGISVAPGGTCTIVVRYAPVDTSAASDSLDIVSNDPDEASVTVSLTGTGIAAAEGGVVTPSPSGSDSGFMAIDPATLLLLGGAGVWAWRRRRL